MKKYLAEMLGTMVLVLMGCGAAVSLGCDNGNAATVVGTALAFGLAVLAMAYTIGGISGCHINPAITLGVFLSGRMSGKDAGMYMLFQVIGGIIGAAILWCITTGAGIESPLAPMTCRHTVTAISASWAVCLPNCSLPACSCSWCLVQRQRQTGLPITLPA